MRTLLQLVNEVTSTLGLGKGIPAAIGSTDPNIIQIVATFQQVGEELVAEEPYITDLSDGQWVVHEDDTESGIIISDLDVFHLDELLLKKSVIWNWKYNKGLEYGEDKVAATDRHSYLATERQTERVHY